jgi:hypothetical protein
VGEDEDLVKDEGEGGECVERIKKDNGERRRTKTHVDRRNKIIG